MQFTRAGPWLLIGWARCLLPSREDFCLLLVALHLLCPTVTHGSVDLDSARILAMRHEELLRLIKTSHVPSCFDVAQQRREHSSQAWFEQTSAVCAGKLMDPIVWHADSTDEPSIRWLSYYPRCHYITICCFVSTSVVLRFTFAGRRPFGLNTVTLA